MGYRSQAFEGLGVGAIKPPVAEARARSRQEHFDPHADSKPVRGEPVTKGFVSSPADWLSLDSHVSERT
jgi:hypothetical protein